MKQIVTNSVIDNLGYKPQITIRPVAFCFMGNVDKSKLENVVDAWRRQYKDKKK